MWLCICSNRQFENHNGEILHICNYCDFASVQAGDLRARVKTHNRRNHKYATNVSLHLFKQAMWRHVKTNISENRSHATNVTLHMFKQAIWRDMWTLTFQKIAHATCVTLPLFKQAKWVDKDMWNITFGKIAHMQLMWLFKQAIWEDMCNITFQKIAHMQLMWLCIRSSRQFEETCEN